VLDELRAYGMEPLWFTLGDKDIATHLVRTQLLNAGYPLSDITRALCRRWRPGVTLLPMTDDRVETHVVVPDGDGWAAIHFQEWWVRHRAALPAREFRFVGIDEAQPGPGVLEAILQSDVVVLPPSNPVVSIGPILAVPGIREAVARGPAPVVGVSGLIGGRPM
jgi:LPPG:FO 2-phospho-L-lactate transferase